MFTLYLLLVFVYLVWMIASIEDAPEGYEDEHGFHLGKENKSYEQF